MTTAESCTGGKLASALCAAEDTPSFYGVGYVTLLMKPKAKILRATPQPCRTYRRQRSGRYEMAIVPRIRLEVNISIAGRLWWSEGEDGTPAGTVWFASNINNTNFYKPTTFQRDCQEVLEKCVRFRSSLNCFFC
ncbi:CinA family protein [Salmonella enterica subsp. enterica]|nr:CinA family protein [Salmonella enterica subsp. enterica]